MMGSVYNRPEWIGKKFNMLTVVEPVRDNGKHLKQWFWKVKCDCGKETIVRPIDIMYGGTVSCGCYRKTRSAWNKSHGESHTRLHNIWLGMIGRCNPKRIGSKRYGKRGIKVCDEWHDYIAFAEWARNNGYSDDLTIERIDVNGDYEPSNCTWISLGRQARNRRTTHYVTYNGKEMSLAEACETAGLPYKQVFERIVKRHWPIDEALSIPMGESTRGFIPRMQVCKCCGAEYLAETVNRKYCSDECRRKVKNDNRRGA